MGTAEFGIPAFETLCDNGYTPISVVTVPDKPAGRGRHVTSSAVKRIVLERNIPVLQPERLKDPAFLSSVSGLNPDLFVVVAFRILPPELLKIPRIGSINLHASLLPKYRGAAPIQCAIMNGERETGVTTFLLDEKIDTGKVLGQTATPIGENETAGELHDRLSIMGKELVLSTVKSLDEGTTMPVIQNDTLATPAPKIFKEDCRIDWNRSAREIHNQIRGLSPRPGAFTKRNGMPLKIFRSAVVDEQETSNPGVVVDAGSVLRISTGKGVLEILQIQQEGKRMLGVEEFLRGYQIRRGDRLE
jgi:methionyl-tRNA formyltransferase